MDGATAHRPGRADSGMPSSRPEKGTAITGTPVGSTMTKA